VLEQRAGPVSADSLVCLKRAGPAAQDTQPNWRRAGWPCRSAAYLSMIVVDRRPIKTTVTEASSVTAPAGNGGAIRAGLVLSPANRHFPAPWPP